MSINPFKFGSIVSGDYFYNREEEILRIKQTLSGGNNLTLYAPRRFGKSSLVVKALKELEQEGFTTIYLDMMSVYSQETFIKRYTQAIAKEQRSIEGFIKKFARLVTGIVPSVSFDSMGNPSFSVSWVEGKDKTQTLNDVFDLPEKLSAPDKKWIVAFDEFQEITKLNGETLEKQLRSSIQHHENVSYLFLGSKTHLLRDMFNNRNRAFYNAALMMTIEPIQKEKSINYLKDRFHRSGINVSDKVGQYLLDKAGNIPYYIQFLAHEIWQSAIFSKQLAIEEENVDHAIETVLVLKDDFYWELTNKQTAYRKKVLVAICRSGSELFSQKTAKTFDLGTASSTQKALDVLIDDGIVDREKNIYYFTDPFYKIFIKRNLSLR